MNPSEPAGRSRSRCRFPRHSRWANTQLPSTSGMPVSQTRRAVLDRRTIQVADMQRSQFALIINLKTAKVLGIIAP
jgi:hypothetical protein